MFGVFIIGNKVLIFVFGLWDEKLVMVFSVFWFIDKLFDVVEMVVWCLLFDVS